MWHPDYSRQIGEPSLSWDDASAKPQNHSGGGALLRHAYGIDTRTSLRVARPFKRHRRLQSAEFADCSLQSLQSCGCDSLQCQIARSPRRLTKHNKTWDIWSWSSLASPLFSLINQLTKTTFLCPLGETKSEPFSIWNNNTRYRMSLPDVSRTHCTTWSVLIDLVRARYCIIR